MSSAISKILKFGTLALVAAGLFFAATQFSTEVEQSDPMIEFKAVPTVPPVASSQGSSAEVAPVDVMLVGLRQRLEKQPDDVDGWVLLSKSYYHLRRWQEAERSFEKAKALGYVGRWQPLPRIDSFSRNAAATQNFGSATDFRDYKTEQDGNRPATEMSPNGSSGGLKLKVSLNPALQKEISSSYPVFVFVRAADNPGPPLAVVRKNVDELPFEITLNDSHVMMPGRTISSAENIIVGARISVSGNPSRQPGDYEELSDPVPANFSETIELVINENI